MNSSDQLFLFRDDRPASVLIEILPGHHTFRVGDRYRATYYAPLTSYRIFTLDGHPMGLIHQMYAKRIEEGV